MDVVRSNVERIGGVVEVDSTPGEGTRMTLRVPLTLTIIPALTVSDRQPAFRHSALGDRGDRPRQRRAASRSSRSAGQASRPSAAAAFPKSRSPTCSACRATSTDEERTLVVLRPAGGDVYALAVDRIHDHEELVVKPAAPAVMATGLYAGTTLADDGSPILLLDPAGLAEVGGVRLEAQERAARVAEAADRGNRPNAVPVLLFRGLDGARRALRLGGGRADRGSRRRARSSPAPASCASSSARRSCRSPACDGRASSDGKVRLFRLNDGASEIGYAFREVIDMRRARAMTSSRPTRRARSAA